MVSPSSGVSEKAAEAHPWHSASMRCYMFLFKVNIKRKEIIHVAAESHNMQFYKTKQHQEEITSLKKVWFVAIFEMSWCHSHIINKQDAFPSSSSLIL